MVLIIFDKVKPKNVWLIKGMDKTDAIQATNIPISRAEVLRPISNSELRVLDNCPLVAMKVT